MPASHKTSTLNTSAPQNTSISPKKHPKTPAPPKNPTPQEPSRGPTPGELGWVWVPGGAQGDAGAGEGGFWLSPGLSPGLSLSPRPVSPQPHGDLATPSRGMEAGGSPASERRRRLPMLRRCFRPKSCTWKRKWSGNGGRGTRRRSMAGWLLWHRGFGITRAGCWGGSRVSGLAGASPSFPCFPAPSRGSSSLFPSPGRCQPPLPFPPCQPGRARRCSPTYLAAPAQVEAPQG